MKIINLIEDTPGIPGFAFEHGLSFYIETASHRLLVDTGASGAFIENAKRHGIDLSLVDTVILSHGHYDHAGGLMDFVKINSKANIYLQKSAFYDFYNLRDGNKKYIGMDKRISGLSQLVLLDGDLVIDGELSLFSGVTERCLWPRGNEILKRKVRENFIQDDFGHEQYLVIFEGDKSVLISGCAHNGILNILDSYHVCYGSYPDTVISGFHTTMPSYTDADDEIISMIGKELLATGSTFYTGHCTAEHPMGILCEIMGEKLVALHSGERII